ncbi:MAG: sulfatase-like hydrolase/transferase [Bryobacteraceae bacterium]|nr:sulfatase-like hydrolase/transferase [Bryobacteraceae bacterium]
MPITRRALLQSLAAPAILRSAASRPNILLLFADDLGYGDLSCYGCPDIRTPNLDKLAAEGVKFTRFYSNAPECTPSRTALLTGRYQQRVGGLECAIGLGGVGRYDEAEWLAKRGDLGLPQSESTISSELLKAGYDTCISGKWHLGYEDKFSPMRHGFQDAYYILGGAVDYVTHVETDGRRVFMENGKPVAPRGYLTDLLADRAIGWMRERSTRKPWFLYLPFTAPHNPFQAPGDGPVDAANWNKGSRESYARMVEHMDRRIGDLLGELARRPDAANTIVVFLSDNGGPQRARNAPFRGFKSSLFEGGIRVPGMMRWPAKFQSLVSAQAAASADLTATLLSAAGVTPSRPGDGIDLTSHLVRRQGPVDRTLFWRYKRGKARRRAVCEGSLKYIDDSGIMHLYDLSTDPAETNNLLSRRPEAIERLESMMAEWEKRVAAPRLAGFNTAAD